LRTTLIIAKDEPMRHVLLALLALIVAGAGAAASVAPRDFATARREAAAAEARFQALDAQARHATGAAERARAQSAALAARIEAAEAGLTLSERRIGRVRALQAAQRARLAERQRPLVRLTAALETMARRPAALALIQPGSVADTAHIRALLAATLPEIRRRTAALRAEVARSAALRDQFESARASLVASRGDLSRQRAVLARFEAEQRARSSALSGLATAESDRALALGERARALAATLGTRRYQAELAASLARLPGPVPRPGGDEGSGGADRPARPRIPYLLPVEGRLLTGVGEISDGGVHSRGLTLAPDPGAPVVAPANGRVLYAARFGTYANVVIIDHGRGWASVVTDLATLDVAAGQIVTRGTRLGRAAARDPRVTIELRHNGDPVPFAGLLVG
jgi:septal ring factor EnvC (AmiA/AmiB activator)